MLKAFSKVHRSAKINRNLKVEQLMYISKLTIKETQHAIKIVKDNFEKRLSERLNLSRVSAPIVVSSDGAINDDLGVKNSALKFKIDSLGYDVEIVQSLAKWKRIALKNYGYDVYEGIYTDMNAIRTKDILDNTHSLYVDQWDWELVINESDRNINFLENIVRTIVQVLKETKDIVRKTYPMLDDDITEEVFFIDAEQLDNMYPNLTMREKEHHITKLHKTVFIKKIGQVFTNGKQHDLRAPDYDDWSLNGDILIWSNVLNEAVELSSMGIRVDGASLLSQLQQSNRLDLIDHPYHQMVLNGELPLTIGGGIGQSRICMIVLEKLHIAEVQASLWNAADHNYFKKQKINIL